MEKKLPPGPNRITLNRSPARPFPLSRFPGIPYEFTEALRSKSIRRTDEFFMAVSSAGQRKSLAQRTGIPEARLQELFALTDLSRIPGIGPVFARTAYDSGIRSLEQYARTGAAVQYEKYRALGGQQSPGTSRYSLKRIESCIGYAKVILEYGTR